MTVDFCFFYFIILNFIMKNYENGYEKICIYMYFYRKKMNLSIKKMKCAFVVSKNPKYGVFGPYFKIYLKFIPGLSFFFFLIKELS